MTAPVAAFNYTITGLDVLFSSTSVPSCQPIAGYEWDLGDGSIATGASVKHTYDAGGTYTAVLNVTNTNGEVGTQTKTFTLTAPSTVAPVADFVETNYVGLAVTFSSNLSRAMVGSITGWAWTFGDGGTSTTANPTYTYANAGTYTVTLTVTNTGGRTDSASQSITVTTAGAGYEYLGNSTAVKTATQLSPSGLAVAQSIVHLDSGEWWMTQATTGTDPTYTENTRISRMSSSGANLGQMILFGAGHGMSLNVEYQGTDPFVWVIWEKPAAGSTRAWDIVRLPWSNTGSTVQSRDNIANLDVMIPGNGAERKLHIDWESQKAVVNSFGSASLYWVSDIIDRGALYPIKTISTPYGGTNTFQGYATYNDSLFYLFGGAKNDGDSDSTDPLQIWEFSWITGQKIKTLSLANVGKSGTATWTGGRTEVEGLCVYDPGVAGVNPQLQLIDVTGVSPNHTWDVWQVDLRTQYEAEGNSGFIVRKTKPTESNVGAGILRAVTTTLNPAGGVLTVTTKQTFKDTRINGQVVVKAAGVIFENCIISGPVTNPGDANTNPGVTVQIVNTNDPACALEPPVFRYSTIYQRFNCPIVNAFSTRYYTVEYCNILNVVDAFSPDPWDSADSDVKVIIRGNYVHDHVFFAGTGSGHSPASNLNTVAGVYVNGPYRAMGWTHCDAVQIESDRTTGVNVYGNNFVATWSRDKNISMMPLPYDNNGDVVIKEMSTFMLNGGKNLIIEDNWQDGGEACVNNSDSTVTGVFRRNRFGRQMAHPLGLTGTSATDDAKYYAFLIGTGLNIYETDTTNRNIWADTGNVVNRHA